MSIIRSLAFAACLASPALALADKPAPAPAPAEKKAPPPAAKEVSDADAQKFMKFFNDLIDIIVKNQDDCTKMAAGISTFVDNNQALIAEGKKAKADGKDIPKAYKDKMDARIQKDMMPALQKKCISDKGVGAAMQKMDAK